MIQVLGDLVLWLAALVLLAAIAAVVLWAPPLILAFWRGLMDGPEITPTTDPYLDEPIYCWIGDHERPRREMRWVHADYVCIKHAEQLENRNVEAP